MHLFEILKSPAAQYLRNKGANIVKGDLDDSDSLEQAVNGVDSIFLMGTAVLELKMFN
jgi:uncharacterized protein YbjT (DUF2867 family)